MTIAETCKAIRKELNMSQKEFAKIIGTNQTEISFIERGFVPKTSRVVAIKALSEAHCIGRYNHDTTTR